MKRLSWKYIAGLVDGEGCFDMQLCKDRKTGEYKYVRPRLRIAQSSPGLQILQNLHTHFGGALNGKNLEGHTNYNSNWDSHYYWCLEGKRLRPFVQNIVNHLIIKKEQARLAIFVIDKVIGKHVPDEVREHLRSEFKAMKSDPQRLSERAAAEATRLITEAKSG